MTDSFVETTLENPRMRVTHIVPRLDCGGVERLLLDLIDYIPEVDTSIIAVNSGGRLQGDFEKRCEIKVLGDAVEDPHKTYAWLNPVSVFKMTRVIKGLRPDIVQTHTFSAASRGRASAKLAGVPVIMDTLHNTYSWKSTHALRIDRWLGRITDTIVCVSEAVQNYAIEQNPALDPDKYKVLYNGINVPRFSSNFASDDIRKILGIGDDELVVGSVSRLVAQKRTIDLINAAPRILDSFPRTKFIIVGEGPEEYRLKTRIKEMGLEDRFVFTGMIENPEEVYPVMDVFAQTSEREGFGLSMVEAMASGVAVVAAKTGAIEEIVSQMHNGFVFEVGDTEELASSIESLLGSANRRRIIGNAALITARNRFNILTTAQNYHSIWTKLLASKSG